MNASRLPLSVRAALRGRTILLTGATGFLAKVVLEDMARNVPDIGCVILLIRPAPDGAAPARLDARARFEREIAPASVFDALRAARPAALRAFFDKIECIDGDVTDAHFGLGAARFAALRSRIDLVVNAAASVDFREPLDRALAINALALRGLCALARAAGAPLLHVSICYVNGYLEGDMPESVTPPARAALNRHPEGWYEVDALIDDLQRRVARVRAKTGGRGEDELARRLTALGIREANRHGWNDTYTFTKWLGEQLALRGMHGAALTILRPSIIESALRTPTPGWLEGVKVADAVILAYARGRTRVFPARPDGILDVIPVDLVANAALLAGAEALACGPGRRIYQCCSGSANPLTLGRMVALLRDEGERNWRRYDKLFRAAPTHGFRMIGALHFRALMAGLALGAGALAGLRRLAGLPAETRAMQKLRTTRLLAVTFAFYAQPRCRFENAALTALAARFGGDDARDFPVDARAIDWPDYLCRVHMAGLNRYALKEKTAAPQIAHDADDAHDAQPGVAHRGAGAPHPVRAARAEPAAVGAQARGASLPRA